MGEQDSGVGLGSKIIYSAIIILVGFFAWAAIPNFVRSGTSPANACINNLRIIDAAKQQWAIENGITNAQIVVRENQITNYWGRSGKMPHCPSLGIYTIGKLGDLPTCSLGTNVTPPHVLQ
jgi:hypothetical protein